MSEKSEINQNEAAKTQLDRKGQKARPEFRKKMAAVDTTSAHRADCYGLLADQASTPAVGTVGTVTVHVDVIDLVAAREIAHGVCSGIEAHAKGLNLSGVFDEDVIADVFRALLYIRIQALDGKSVHNPRLYWKKVEYPACLFPIYRSIGRMTVDGYYIVPRIAKGSALAKFESYTADQWERVAEELVRLVDYGRAAGMEIATAMPKDTAGNLAVMAMLYAVDGPHTDGSRQVDPAVADSNPSSYLAENAPHALPADLLLRSVLSLSVVEANVFGTPRVMYDTIEAYQIGFVDFAKRCFRGV